MFHSELLPFQVFFILNFLNSSRTQRARNLATRGGHIWELQEVYKSYALWYMSILESIFTVKYYKGQMTLV